MEVMKFTKRLLLLLNLLILSIFGITNPEQNLPKDIIAIVEKNKTDLLKKAETWKKQPRATGGVNTKKFSWLPNFYVKFGIDRFYNAERLQQFIQQNDLDSMGVPQKYIYKYQGDNEQPSNCNSVVVVEEIKN